MLKTNVLRKVKTITFTSTPSFLNEYLNKSFEYIEESGQFIDWLNGGIRSAATIGQIVLHPAEYDTDFFNRHFTKTQWEYTFQKILQRLQLHQGEFYYPYENTDDIGIPYLDKPSVEELDLFIKDAILSVDGVKEITKFISRKDSDNSKYGTNKLGYFAEFEVKTIYGEIVAQKVAL